MNKQKLLLIAPHSDDILFSCSYFLLHPEEYECEVLTVENNPKRIKEDEALYSFLNIPFHHLEVDFDDQSYYGYHKRYKEVTVDESLLYLKEFFGTETLNDIEYQLQEFLAKFLKKHKQYTVVAPWGIGHPFHLYIRYLLEQNVSTMWYYREFPHSYKKRSRVQVEKQQQVYELIHSFPVAEFDDVKWMLAKKMYKSQSGLLFFEQGYIKKQLPEEIYIKKEQELPF
jgi:hypothetical protein